MRRDAPWCVRPKDNNNKKDSTIMKKNYIAPKIDITKVNVSLMAASLEVNTSTGVTSQYGRRGEMSFDDWDDED